MPKQSKHKCKKCNGTGKQYEFNLRWIGSMMCFTDGIRDCECRQENEPYIIKEVKIVKRFKNHKYGDERVCICGHTYDRHFDPFEESDEQDVGCKYCECVTFKEKD